MTFWLLPEDSTAPPLPSADHFVIGLGRLQDAWRMTELHLRFRAFQLGSQRRGDAMSATADDEEC